MTIKTKNGTAIQTSQRVNFILSLILDAVILYAAQFLALFTRFEFDYQTLLASGYLDKVNRATPVYLVCALILFILMGMYKSLWKYVSIDEAVKIVKVSAVVCILQYFCMSLLKLYMPRSFPIMNMITLSLLLAISRFSYRVVQEIRNSYSAGNKVRSMLIGAGAAGSMVIREMQNSRFSKNHIVCIIDDDPVKQHSSLNGVPIVGTREDIGRMVQKYRVEEIILALPSSLSSERREIVRLCQQTGCETKIMPSLAEIANGADVAKLRKVRIEDLLGRDSVKVDMSEISEHISGKTVLVTGGGGSIGSELCRQIAARDPKNLIIFDIYENNAYSIQQELLHSFPELNLTVLIGSVRDEKRMEDVFSRYRPQIVYHAAAHKHVPLMEDSPAEAIKNNVFGTLNTARMADRYGTETFVLISSDKAVNPTNVMGASKRICEMIIQMFSGKSKTRFVAVRFGNVLGSNGSVIPLFRKQIEYGGPVTVTDKDIIRYFMTIPEAVSLVMQAGVYAKGGEIYVLDMGSPVRIDDLARNMIRLSGLVPDEDIKIEYTGLRPGEKLFEEILLDEEGLEKTANNLIFVGHFNDFSESGLNESLENFRALCDANSPEVVDEIKRLVKNFNHRLNR